MVMELPSSPTMEPLPGSSSRRLMLDKLESMFPSLFLYQWCHSLVLGDHSWVMQTSMASKVYIFLQCYHKRRRKSRPLNSNYILKLLSRVAFEDWVWFRKSQLIILFPYHTLWYIGLYFHEIYSLNWLILLAAFHYFRCNKSDIRCWLVWSLNANDKWLLSEIKQ